MGQLRREFRSVTARMRAVAERNGYGIRQEGDETFGLIGPEIDPDAAVEHELDALLAPKVSL
jgi:hypothetical protein